MGTSLDTELQTYLRSYLAREISLGAFMDWLAGATWDSEARMSDETHDLTDEILLSWAEYTSGHLTEQELREQLDNVVSAREPLRSPHLPRTGS